MTRLTALIIAVFMILVASVYCLGLFVLLPGPQNAPAYGVVLLIPPFALLFGGIVILERAIYGKR